MDEKEYMELRLGAQLNWYDQKSAYNQKRYKTLRLIEIICAASIPFLFGLGELVGDRWYWAELLRSVAALFAVVVAISSSVLGLCKYQDNWMAYRTTCEMLRHEKYFYETHCGPYKEAKDPFGKLVERVEKLISQENTSWREYISKDEDKEGGTPENQASS